jgi:hypothetical protein
MEDFDASRVRSGQDHEDVGVFREEQKLSVKRVHMPLGLSGRSGATLPTDACERPTDRAHGGRVGWVSLASPGRAQQPIGSLPIVVFDTGSACVLSSAGPCRSKRIEATELTRSHQVGHERP